jgi:branched-chain amino acid transport system ATP-binding protein
MDILLEAKGLRKRFGGLKALDVRSFQIPKHQIKAVIGPNGAGKTTLFNVINGLERADSGKIRFKGMDMGRMVPARIAEMGISRTYQTTQVFERLNVVENILLGRYLKTQVSFVGAGLWLSNAYREEHRNRVRAYEILEFLGLYEKADRKISQVSHLERKLVELGRAIATEPELLLLDEPFGGLTAREGRAVSEKVVGLKNQGITIAMIDHHFGRISEISEQIAVLHHGEIIAEGSPDEIMGNRRVRSAYFPEASGWDA